MELQDTSRMSKLTCHTCRSRKVRCDGKQPVCTRCTQTDRECNYQRTRQFSFRHSNLSLLVNGKNGNGNEPIQTRDDNYDTPQPRSETAYETSTPPHLENPTSALSPLNNDESRHSHEDIEAAHTYHYGEPSSVGTTRSSLHASTPDGLNSNDSNPQNQASSDQNWSARQLTQLEGELLHFYVCKIGPWLDVTSPERHYTYTVPSLALQWPLLFNAIMTCSAHILRLLSKNERAGLGGHEANYQSKCLEILIPLLDDLNAAFQDEVVLATITILRMSEQYEQFHVDRQFHLVPQAFDHFHAMGPSSTTLGGLREATFYSYIRADIRMAILGKCGTRMNMDEWPLQTTLINDADWANRMTFLFVHVINLCLDPDSPGVLPKSELEGQIDSWRNNLPSTFQPYYYEAESIHDPFPTYRLLCPWHIVGHQFYHSAKILLATTFLQDNGGFTDALQFNKRIASDVLPHARMLCGISFSNKHHGCRINASHLLALGAQFFTSQQEQLRVLGYFEMLQEESAWPSRACREMLNEAYGFDPDTGGRNL